LCAPSQTPVPNDEDVTPDAAAYVEPAADFAANQRVEEIAAKLLDGAFFSRCEPPTGPTRPQQRNLQGL
jgi:hypothetical protein